MYRCKGTITVFLSLVSILFLSLFCTLIESARLQGARLQAAAALDLSLFSVFGEYDKVLLEEYDLWFLDGSYGEDHFEKTLPEERIQYFLCPNVYPSAGLGVDGSWNLFPMEIDSCEVSKYALATDDGGEVFYHQAVENHMGQMAGTLLSTLIKNNGAIAAQEKEGEAYEKEEKSADKALEQAMEEEKQNNEKISGDEDGSEESRIAKGGDNPLEVIKKIKKTGILALVMKNPEEISDKKLTIQNLPSNRKLNEGTLTIKESRDQVSSNAVFLDYLQQHFRCALDKGGRGALSYELEYIAGGKNSDVENLKEMITKIMLFREGANYICIAKSAVMSKEALALAAAIAGGLASPALTKALQKVLMLAWAYGESLMDVRTLLAGGKVPLVKTEKDWRLSLDNLKNIEALLEECDKGGGNGQSYREYLTGILALKNKKVRNLRTLDIIEINRRSERGGENFRADALIAQMEAECLFSLRPVFLIMPVTFMELQNQGISYRIKGQYGYMEGGV